MNAMINMISDSSVIATIEDSPELQIVQKQWISLLTRKSADSVDERNDFGYSKLMKISLRHRPTCIIIGESREKEVRAVFQIFATGHTSMSTFHASSSEKLLHRLQGDPINIHEAQFDDMWFLMQIGRLVQNGKILRRVMAYSEMQLVKENSNTQIKPVDIITYNPISKEFEGIDIDNILAKSQKIHEAAIWNGIKDIKKEMENRVEYLKKCASEKIFDGEKIIEEISKYKNHIR